MQMDKAVLQSPPSWWSGLKYKTGINRRSSASVSTLVVEWIEILLSNVLKNPGYESPPSWWSGLKLEKQSEYISCEGVSTLVVEWIEINFETGARNPSLRSPPSWWSGLKFPSSQPLSMQACLHPRGGVD